MCAGLSIIMDACFTMFRRILLHRLVIQPGQVLAGTLYISEESFQHCNFVFMLAHLAYKIFVRYFSDL